MSPRFHSLRKVVPQKVIPIEQGLKHRTRNLCKCSPPPQKVIPIEQGLKPMKAWAIV